MHDTELIGTMRVARGLVEGNQKLFILRYHILKEVESSECKSKYTFTSKMIYNNNI
jgi:hypothetical protein